MNSTPLRLHYSRPAKVWTDALPIGNGRLGAMCFGGVEVDRFQLNDDTCWSGSPASVAGHPPVRTEAAREVLSAVREALDTGDARGADTAVRRLQHGHSQAYQPLADLWLTQAGTADGGAGTPDDGPAGYRRALDLRTAIASHGWTQAGVDIRQEAWSSRPAGALLVHRWASPRADDAEARLPETTVRIDSPHPTASCTRVAGNGLELVARMPSDVIPSHDRSESPVTYDETQGASVTAVAQLRVVTDGQVGERDGGLVVSGASWFVVLLGTQTDYVDPLTTPHGDVVALRTQVSDRLEGLVRRLAADGGTGDGVDALRDEHVADHGALFGRVDLRLGAGAHPNQQGLDELPTDDRLIRHAGGHPDPGLAALLFQYGRYLLIASSRPGTLPANLQGIWNASVRPPWSSNYTVNINLEMNYWPAEVANLAECHTALTDWLRHAHRTGRAVARDLYGLDGWALHHNSDAWGFALPVGDGTHDPCWAAWPLGAAWLCRHLWDHYDYGRDETFLREVAWPLVRDATAFCLDWLVERPDGSLAVSPSTSPENHFVAPDGKPAAVSVSTTADVAMIRDLLDRALDLQAAVDRAGDGDGVDVTGSDNKEWRERVTDALNRLPAERVGADGRVAEWSTELTDAEPKHRHMSHLFGVYPAERIGPDSTPDLAAAALQTLTARGDYSTGWSLAWRVSLRARLHDPDGAQTALRAFLAMMPDEVPESPAMGPGGVYRSLLCAHPPFQIDGNFGVTAGIAEMLVQSHDSTHDVTELHLLPALPESWRDGAFTGLRARGGVTVDAEWTGGAIERVYVTADTDRRIVVRAADERVTVDVRAGERRAVDGVAPAGRVARG